MGFYMVMCVASAVENAMRS